MVVLGLLILIVVAIAVVTMVTRGNDGVRIDLDSLGSFDTDAGTVFLLGALTCLVGVLGVVILFAGLKRARRRRTEVRRLKDRAQRAEAVQSRDAPASQAPPSSAAESDH